MNLKAAKSYPELRTLNDLPVDGRRVILRVDFNVSMSQNGSVDETEDFRIKAAVPTIEELQQRRCKILILTHLGEPQKNPRDLDVSPVRRRLEQILGEEVRSAERLSGPVVRAVTDGLSQGEIAMLPNVRGDAREEMNSDKFARELADLADVYVNEAFSVSHRQHASVALLPAMLPACAGRHTVLEIEELNKLKGQPARPYVAITAGAKIETKVGMLKDFIHRVDTLCVGGQIANVFLAAQGKYKGHASEAELKAAEEVLRDGGEKVVLPVDVVTGENDGSNEHIYDVESLPEDATICDVGPKTVALFMEKARGAQTVIWNGPLGKFEVPAYEKATCDLAKALGELTNYRVVGGGDTVKALALARVLTKYSHVSTGGGAMIAYLEGLPMPGLQPLWKV